MAEYINREKLLDELGESASHHAESGREYQLLLRDRNIVREQPTADVIERSEYEKLRLVNLDLAETNKGLLAEHEQLLELRSKIDKALEQTYKVRDIVLHSNRMYEPNDVLEIIDEITAYFEEL